MQHDVDFDTDSSEATGWQQCQWLRAHSGYTTWPRYSSVQNAAALRAAASTGTRLTWPTEARCSCAPW